MNVVVNATPLIALALVGQLSLLREMFDAVIVQRAVYEEVVTDGNDHKFSTSRISCEAAIVMPLYPTHRRWMDAAP